MQVPPNNSASGVPPPGLPPGGGTPPPTNQATGANQQVPGAAAPLPGPPKNANPKLNQIRVLDPHPRAISLLNRERVSAGEPKSEAVEPEKKTGKEEKGTILSKMKAAAKTLIGIKDPVKPEMSFHQLLNFYHELMTMESICDDQEETQQRAKLAAKEGKTQKAQDLNKILATNTESYNSTLQQRDLHYAKYHLTSSRDLLPFIKADLAANLGTKEGLHSVVSTLLQIPSKQDTTVLVGALTQIDIRLLKSLTEEMLSNRIGAAGDPLLRQKSLTTDLFRELNNRVLGQQLIPVLRQCIQRNVIDTKGQVTNQTEILRNLLKDIHEALTTSKNPESHALHDLYRQMRRMLAKTAPGKETPLMINLFTLRVVGNYITNPELLGLTASDAERSACARLQKELQGYLAVAENPNASLQDPVFGPLAKDLLIDLDPLSDPIKTMGYGRASQQPAASPPGPPPAP